MMYIQYSCMKFSKKMRIKKKDLCLERQGTDDRYVYVGEG